MRHDIVYVATILGSLVFSHFLRERTRSQITPWFFAYYLLVIVVIGSVGGFFHFIFTSLNFVVIMLLCNGFKTRVFKGNPVACAFLIFQAYFIIAHGYGYAGYYAIVEALQSLNIFFIGVYTADWLCRTENSMRMFLVPIVLVSMIAACYYTMHGGLSFEVDEFGRGGLDVYNEDNVQSVNVNAIGMFANCLLSFLAVAFLMPSKDRIGLLIKLFAIGSFVVMCLVLIRSGSRNAALGLIPILWFFVFASQKIGARFSRIGYLSIIIMVLVVGVRYVMRDAGEIRAFSITRAAEDNGKSSILDSISSGRLTMYERALEGMSPLEKIIGRGGFTKDYVYSRLYQETGRFMLVNDHSMFMSIFYTSGFVGIILFTWFVLSFITVALKCEERGRIALMFFGVWFLTGVAESWGIHGGASQAFCGLGIGLLTRRGVLNSELMTSKEKRQSLRYWG